MRSKQALILLALAGTAAAVHAQDSIGTAPGLPGDAVNPLAADQQVLSYVADLTPFGTSWGTTFGIVPLVKGVQTDPQFFTGFVGANAISDDLVRGVPFASSQYALWEQAPGVGVNPVNNSDAYQLVSPSGESSQFAVAPVSSLSPLQAVVKVSSVNRMGRIAISNNEVGATLLVNKCRCGPARAIL